MPPIVNVGQFTRPDIYEVEYNNSVIASQVAQGITNLVIGVAKTGPINTPVLIKTTTDLVNAFGSYDRSLERKGSYFQRTIAQMIQSSPVYAINLLETDDTLDRLQYAPLSTAVNNTNDIIRNAPYSHFFNTTGFWNLDTDAFLFLAKSNPNYLTRLFNLTNTSNGYITVFIFRTSITGYNTTMLTYYGTVENMPPYVYPTDYVSDYMVDVIVVSGNWSNYASLSVDPTWGKYFDPTGLRKAQVTNFVNNSNVTILKYYQGLSFIPYFRDINNNNIFIETVINNDTNSTGLFCAFNIDAYETAYPTYQVDLIGNNLIQQDNLIDNPITNINFLSYNDSLIQTVVYSDTILDTIGNVYSLDPSFNLWNGIGNLSNEYRTNWYEEDSVHGISYTASTTPASSMTVLIATASPSNGIDIAPYAVINGVKILINPATTSFVVNATDFSSNGTYSVVYKLDTTGNITQTEGNISLANPTVNTTDIVLFYSVVSISGATISNITYNNIALNTTGFVDLQKNTDYIISSTNAITNQFTITFTQSSGTIPTSNYAAYRRLKRYNSFKNILQSVNSKEATLLYCSATTSTPLNQITYKSSLSGMSVIVDNATSDNKSITITTNLGLTGSAWTNAVYNWQNNGFCFYKTDNEQIMSDYLMLTTNKPLNTSGPGGTASNGVVALHSQMYLDFQNGDINTGDYFYANIIPNSTYIATFSFYSASGSNYLIAELNGSVSTSNPFDVITYDTISVPSSILNTGIFNITGITNLAAGLGFSASNTWAYPVSESIVVETLSNVTTIYDATTQYYLSMSTDTNDNLSIYITDNSLTNYIGTGALTVNLNNPGLGDYTNQFSNNGSNQIWGVVSKDSNYQETVELTIPIGYTQSLMTNIILVDASRYTNIAVGDFLEAYVATASLVSGQIGKKLTRILTKKLYTGSTTIVQITCDAIINISQLGSGYQTMRYASLDNYTQTYKAIPLFGFNVRPASLPDGTDATQTSILNLVALGTPLFNAIINKDAFSFRYLIDSFGLGLTEQSKQPLVDICGARLDCFGFINMPSIKQFKQSSSPSFIDANGVLQTSFIAAGGDPNSNPAFLYSFGNGVGASCVGYFTPYIILNDLGRPTPMPPAMMVATTYMRKLNSNVTSIVPWTVAAGINNGQILNIAGLEMDFSPDDISNLNLASMNPIVVKKNNGFVIDTENTAMTLFKSSLSYIHAREVLIELEDALSAMLLGFQWKFNTPDVRAEIKLRADVICSGFVSQKGLSAYVNVCDASNNTPTLIQNQIGVIDTYVEIINAMGVIVNNITILRTGAIASGGFNL